MIDSAFTVGASATAEAWLPEPTVSAPGTKVSGGGHTGSEEESRDQRRASDGRCERDGETAGRDDLRSRGVDSSVRGSGRDPFPDRTPMLRHHRGNRRHAWHSSPVFATQGGWNGAAGTRVDGMLDHTHGRTCRQETREHAIGSSALGGARCSTISPRKPIEELARSSIVRRYPQGQILCSEGDPGDKPDRAGVRQPPGLPAHDQRRRGGAGG